MAYLARLASLPGIAVLRAIESGRDLAISSCQVTWIAALAELCDVTGSGGSDSEVVTVFSSAMVRRRLYILLATGQASACPISVFCSGFVGSVFFWLVYLMFNVFGVP